MALFYEICDTLLGQNYVKQDVKRAVELAATCQHPDAEWLTKIFFGKNVRTPEEAKTIFLEHEPDARALCFSALLFWPWDITRLRRSAEMGFAFAQAVVAGNGHASKDRIYVFALQATLQGERNGYAFLALCYLRGTGCERNVIKAKENYLIAAKLNHVPSMIDYGFLVDNNDPQRWRWLGEAAKKGATYPFLSGFASIVDRFDSDPSLAPVVFAIGRALKGHINTETKTIFGDNFHFPSRIGPANRAINFFVAQCAAARKAVDAWCLMAVRINSKVNKDIRKKIGMLIWNSRTEGIYELDV